MACTCTRASDSGPVFLRLCALGLWCSGSFGAGLVSGFPVGSAGLCPFPAWMTGGASLGSMVCLCSLQLILAIGAPALPFSAPAAVLSVRLVCLSFAFRSGSSGRLVLVAPHSASGEPWDLW